MTSAPKQARPLLNAEAERSPASTQPEGAVRSEAVPASPWQESPRQLQQSTRLAQLRSATAPAAEAPAREGLPEGLQKGIESLSGVDMSGVRVHRNSSQPAALQAKAFAQGQDIHLGPGQEQHLPHEAWHVVQQKQGRVRPTERVAGHAVNTEPRLEAEADRMGQLAQSAGAGAAVTAQRVTAEPSGPAGGHAVQYKKGQQGRGGPPQIPHRNKPREEQQRRRAIGEHHARQQPPVRRRQRGPGPQQHVPPQGPPQHQGGPQGPGGQHPVPGGNGPLIHHPPDPHPDHVALDIFDDAPLGHQPGGRGRSLREVGGRVGKRVGGKLAKGRTFGDGANALGAIGGAVSDSSALAGALLTTISGAGVALNGMKLFYDGVRETRTARTGRAKRDVGYGILAGMANLASGFYSIEAGIASLVNASTVANVAGAASAGTWALSEATNVLNQIDVLVRKFNDGRPLRSYLKPTLSLLASLMKCTGASLAMYTGILKVQGGKNDDANFAANFFTFLGIAISLMHGIIKLILVCKQELGREPEDDQENDEEDEHGGGPPVLLGEDLV